MCGHKAGYTIKISMLKSVFFKAELKIVGVLWARYFLIPQEKFLDKHKSANLSLLLQVKNC